MRQSIKAAIRISEIKDRMTELDEVETRSTEQETEFQALKAERPKMELEYRTSATSEEAEQLLHPRDHNVTPETRERLELRNKSKLGSFISAAINRQPVDGAESEFASASGCSALGQIPIAIFDRDRVETRAITPGVDAQNTPNPTAPFIFERSVLSSVLGVQLPTVESGVANYPVITTGVPSGAVAKGGAAVATAAAVRLDTRSPKRIAGQFEIRNEDLAVMPSLEDDLRVSLMSSASNALDEQGIAGSGVSPNLTGLFKLATDVSIASDLETFGSGVARFSKLVEGQYSYSLRDVRAIIGSETFGFYSGLFAGNGSLSLADYLQERLGGFAVSNRVPDKSGDGQKALAVLTGGEAPMRLPVWSNMEIVVDPYSKAGTGVRVVTVTSIVGDPHLPYGVSTVKEVHPKIS